MPAFWLDMSQIATNHFLSSRWVPSIIVPAVTLNWREHLVHCHLWACPCTLEQVRFPHAGQTKPPGCLSSRSLLSHDSSSGYLSRSSIRVPLLSHSCLLRPPAWPFAISSPDPPDASAVHPYDAAERRQEFLRLCRRSSAISLYFASGYLANAAVVEKASLAGAKYAFTSFHIPEESGLDFAQEAKRLIALCRDHGLALIADVSPATLAKLGCRDFGDVGRLGVEYIRLDDGFDARQTVELSDFFHVVFNASTISESDIARWRAAGADFSRFAACHNSIRSL